MRANHRLVTVAMWPLLRYTVRGGNEEWAETTDGEGALS
jgi:hypothetical protein